MDDGKESVEAFVGKRVTLFTGQALAMPYFYPWWNLIPVRVAAALRLSAVDTRENT